MATREEKLQIVERLKTEIEATRKKIEEREEMEQQRLVAGSLIRTGIVLLITAVGIGLAVYYLF